MSKLSYYEKVDVHHIRTKNKKILSNYLFMSDKNQNREKAMVTFTSPIIQIDDKLTHIKLIKNRYI